MISVGVEKSCLLTRGKHLKREFATGSVCCLSTEDFSGYFDVWIELKGVIIESRKFAKICRAEVRAFFDCLNLFHIRDVVKMLV